MEDQELSRGAWGLRFFREGDGSELCIVIRATGAAVRNMSAGGALTGGGEGSSSCLNYIAPPLTISNALAQFDVQTSGFRATLRHSEHRDADRRRSEI
jgi:hypothetical protein